jgi:hypothetical protein
MAHSPQYVDSTFQGKLNIPIHGPDTEKRPFWDAIFTKMQAVPNNTSDNPLKLASRQVTQTDLKELKEELLKEIKIMIHDQPKPPKRKWLKNKAVMDLLEISPGTLQVLRDKGTIAHTRLGRTIYYDPDDIEKELQRRKANGRTRTHYSNSED